MTKTPLLLSFYIVSVEVERFKVHNKIQYMF